MLHLIGLATGFLMLELPPDSMGTCGPARYLSAGYGCAGSALDTKNCTNNLCGGAGQGSLQPGAPGNGDGGNIGTEGSGNGGGGDSGSGSGGGGNNGTGIPPGTGSGNIPGPNTPDGTGFSVTPAVFQPISASEGGNAPLSPAVPGFKVQPVVYDSRTPKPTAPPIPIIPRRSVPGTKIASVPPPALFTKTVLLRSVVTANIPQFTTLFVNNPPVTIKEPPVTTTYTMPPEVVVETQPPVVVALPPTTVVSTPPPKTIVETLPPATITEPAVTITMTERYTMPPVTSIHTQVYPPVTFTKVYPPVTFTKTYPPVTLTSPPSTLFVVSTSVPPPRVFTRSTFIYVTSTVQNRPVTVTYFVERPSSRFSTVYGNRPVNAKVPGRPGMPSNGRINRPGMPGSGFPNRSGVPGTGFPGMQGNGRGPGSSAPGLPGGGVPSNTPGTPGGGVPGLSAPGFGIPGNSNTPSSGNAQGNSNMPGSTFGNVVSGDGSNTPRVITIPSEGSTGISTRCDMAVSPCLESLMTGTYTPPPSDDVCSDTNFSACASPSPEVAEKPSRKRKKRHSRDSSEGSTKKDKAESEQDSESSQKRDRKKKKNKKNSKDNSSVKNDTKEASSSSKSRVSSLKSELNSSVDNPSQNSSPNWLINKIASLVSSSTPKKSSLVPEGTANDDDKTEVLYLSDLVGNQN